MLTWKGPAHVKWEPADFAIADGPKRVFQFKKRRCVQESADSAVADGSKEYSRFDQIPTICSRFGLFCLENLLLFNQDMYLP